MTKRIPALAVGLVLLTAPLLAACGSSTNNTASASGSGSTTQSSSAATVRTASVSGLGRILVGPGGRTIYLFQRDTGPTSTCSGACLAQWPAVTTHDATHAAGGASAGKLGVTKRSDGTMQVTYAGHPLYYYAGDSSAGDANGQGLDAYGAKWYAMAPSGTAITRQASGDGNARGGYGY
jgi:predicted lipoprotein with Yx(FWY)xxD motif